MGQVQTELPDQKMLWAEFGLASRLGEIMLTKIPTVPVPSGSLTISQETKNVKW